MPGEKVKIGPWKGGLNQQVDMRSIEDDELAECLNFNITDDGLLEPRAGVTHLSSPAHGYVDPTLYLLGSVVEGGNQYAIAGFFDGTNEKIYSYLSSSSGTARHGTAATPFAGKYRSVVQYNSKIWYVPGDATAVGKQLDDLSDTTPTDVAAMPWGDYGFMFKDRMFIVRKSENRIYFSKATDPTIWASPDGGSFDVNPGDGQAITKVVVTNNIMTIFKRDATYNYSYVDDPLRNGTLRQVSPDQGAFDAITYNNEIYCVNTRSVFKFINGYFVDIGQKLDLFRDHTIDGAEDPGVRLSVLNRILLVGQVYDSQRARNVVYAMNLDTNAWSQHTYADVPDGNCTPSTAAVTARDSFGTYVYWGDGSTNLLRRVYTKTTSQLDVTASGASRYWPGYKFVTKEFSFGNELEWKRLYAWGVEADPIENSVVVTPTPIVGVKINGTIVSTTDEPLDFFSQLSARFRRVAFIYDAYKPDPIGLPCSIPVLTTNTLYMKTFRSLTALISTKTKVVT